MNLQTYIDRKREAEKRKDGYVEYASVEIHHVHKSCNCQGANPACRQTTRREWRKPAKAGGI
jgi:hypothetical protein